MNLAEVNDRLACQNLRIRLAEALLGAAHGHAERSRALEHVKEAYAAKERFLASLYPIATVGEAGMLAGAGA